jgi:hypothetical protein
MELLSIAEIQNGVGREKILYIVTTLLILFILRNQFASASNMDMPTAKAMITPVPHTGINQNRMPNFQIYCRQHCACRENNIIEC